METRQKPKRNICGQNLRRLRMSKNYSQSQFALKCQLAGWDVDRKLISKIETGFREVGDVELRVIASVLGVNIEGFFDLSKRELAEALQILAGSEADGA